MGMSNTWSNENTIYNPTNKLRDMNKLIYRSSNGFEAFVVGETEDCFILAGNGVKSKVWKSTSKPRIVKVSSDYELRKFSFSK